MNTTHTFLVENQDVKPGSLDFRVSLGQFPVGLFFGWTTMPIRLWPLGVCRPRKSNNRRCHYGNAGIRYHLSLSANKKIEWRFLLREPSFSLPWWPRPRSVRNSCFCWQPGGPSLGTQGCGGAWGLNARLPPPQGWLPKGLGARWRRRQQVPVRAGLGDF